MTEMHKTIGRAGAFALAAAFFIAVNLHAAGENAAPDQAQAEKQLKASEAEQLALLKNATNDAAALKARLSLMGVYEARKNYRKAIEVAAELFRSNQAADAALRAFTKARNAMAAGKEKDFSALEDILLGIEKKAQSGKAGFELDNARKARLYEQMFMLYGVKPGSGGARIAYAKKLLGVPGIDVSLKVMALTSLAGTCKTTYGVWNAGYIGRYVELKPESELSKMQDDYLAYMNDLVQLQVPNAAQAAAYRNELAEALLYKGDVKQALAHYQAVAALGLEKAGKQAYGDAAVGIANCLFAQKDKAAAIKVLEDLDALGLNTASRGGTDPAGYAKVVLQHLKGLELDYLKLPYHTGAKVYPAPQHAIYSETFAALPAVKLAPDKEIGADDARIQLLKRKFERFGIKIDNSAGFTVKIMLASTNAPGAPDKPEGYALAVAKNEAAINGHDMQGVLWGIVSLVQLVDQERKAVRLCEISDWPDTARRGYLEGFWKDSLEFALFNKMNSVSSQHGPFGDNRWTPLNTFLTQESARQFKAFGLDRYYGVAPYAMYPQPPLSRPSTLDLHVREFSKVAEAGGHIYFPFDDGRYPMNEMDKAEFKIGANIDAKYVTKLFLAIREKHPDFKLVFCPPFYWGPDAPASYPEDRENYLRSLGEHLHPDIEVYWTGPGVKGLIKTKRQADWFAKLIKRKPTIFQNGTGPHNLLSYIVDETDWNAWHYPGFFENDIHAFHKNSHMGGEGAQNSTLADCLWNVKAYDPAKSIRASTAMLFGKDMFDILKPGRDAMTYFDKYPYGSLTPEIVTENVANLEAKAKIAADCWEKARKYNEFALKNYGGAYGGGVVYAAAVAKGAKNPPDFLSRYKKDIADTEKVARDQVGIGKGDIFKSPVDMPGGILSVYAHRMCPVVRFVSILYASQTPANKVTFKFECDPFPPAGAYEMHISAMDDERPEQVKIRIAVNDKVIFEGLNPFPAKNYSVEKFTIPFEALLRYNTVTIANIEPGVNKAGPPWFMVNYAVLKKAPIK
ncbi:MAG: hypothetical protein GX608_04965 [Lentisphaerae bacterium]|nr:hypothetical protein [Lentisphaerota bacterium]